MVNVLQPLQAASKHIIPESVDEFFNLYTTWATTNGNNEDLRTEQRETTQRLEQITVEREVMAAEIC